MTFANSESRRHTNLDRNRGTFIVSNSRAYVFCTAALALLNAACQPAPKSAPGLAALTVRVIAEPKSGYRAPSDGDAYSMGQSTSDPDGRFARVDYRDLRDIIVSVHAASPNPNATASADGHAPPASPTVTLAIQNERSNRTATAEIFGPVFGASVGAQISVLNSTSTPHEIYSLSSGNEFDLGSLAPGARAETVIKSSGLIEVLSTARDAPVGWVYAVDTPWVHTASARSNLVLTNLPPGEYEIRSWHPRLPGESRTVRLLPDAADRVELRVGVDQLSRP